MNAYLFEVAEARSFRHPVFTGIQKHQFLVQASKLPHDLPTGANARDPVGMNRQVYRDVKESLKGNEAVPGSFDLMNLGITIIADRVELVDKQRGLFRVFIDDEDGIVNGAHTARIIQETDRENAIPDTQYVEVRIVTGVQSTQHPALKADIAKGQNTGIAVKDESIYDLEGRFNSLRSIVAGQRWADRVAWKESDKGEIHVRDLICVLEALNVIDYPYNSGHHPIHAYEKTGKALENYAADHKAHEGEPEARTFAALEPLLLEALFLFDRIRHDFRDLYNKHVNKGAGHLRVLEEAAQNKLIEFPFSGDNASRYRLTKGAALPIFAAFRNFVEIDPDTKKARWIGGFTGVLRVWQEAGPELVTETKNAMDDIGHLPDQLGKARGHWSGLHRVMRLRALELKTQQLSLA